MTINLVGLTDMIKLSLNLNVTEPVEGKDSFPEDSLFTSLENKVNQWYSDDFTQSITACRESLEEATLKLKTEDLSIYSEDWKAIIDRIWTAIKNFFTRLGSILMFWKKKVNTFFTDKTREIQKYLPIADKLNATTEFDVEKLNNVSTTIFLLQDSSSLDERFSFNNTIIFRMSRLFDNLKTYINDPEMNHKDKLVELERSDDEFSFKEMLGVELISNTKEELSPSRMIINGVMNMFESIRIGNENKLTDIFDINDNQSFGQVKGSLHELLKITKNSMDLSHMLESIEKSYNEIGNGIKWKLHSKYSTDVHVTTARTSVVVKAKDHISKSKVLMEEFVKLLNMMCVSMLNMVRVLDSCKK